jgi:NAD(P)-dependent dehydrogenase (short-subunit alcohol dehydrogenase family)
VRSLRGKTAVITGAASGIGRALAERLARERMRLVLADIDGRALREVARRLPGAMAIRADVSRLPEVESLAAKAYARFGAVHLLCNNAGVAEYGAVWEVPIRRWRRVVGANLWGAVHGCLAFVPRMIAQKESAHIVNTASMAGLVTPPLAGAYSVTKHAVVALSETLHHDLRERGSAVGVSVLCPAYVPTGIADSERNRPAGFEPTPKSKEMLAREQMLKKAVSSGRLSAEEVAKAVVQAVKEERFYVLTHPRIKGAIRARMEDILEERAPRNPMSL